ncbi:hypothetical protein KL866_10870 [Alteromonas sp. ALT199]|uniref:hypothetical protein n=1 Tax=unclassified Alteromonas TaxID=2614992 RepID=UPI001BEA7E31|nr:hypothetical protein [Alteromonas sp. ALT199]MBT3135601.1 hypothetical protein [Alteromonas sp. ALT199]
MANTINLSPNAVNFGEVLGPWTMPHKLHNWALKSFGLSYEGYLDYLWSNNLFFYSAQSYSAYSHLKKRTPINFKRKRNLKTLGIKDFYTHIRRNRIEDYFIRQEQMNVIHLRRDNLLKRLVSSMLMNKVGVVSTKDDAIKDLKAEINVQRLLKYLDSDAELDRAEKDFVKKLEKRHPVYKVSYEAYFKDIESLNRHNREIFEFIGLEPIEKMSHHKKILSNDLKNVVGNYEELEREIKLTPHERYLY